MSVIATEKQINFILSLAEKKDISNVHPIALGCIEDIRLGYADSITKKYASKMIDILMTAPRSVSIQNNDVQVDAGRYAVTIGEKLRFFHINRPEDGRWAGYTFVNEQAGDELFGIRDANRRKMILETIANDDHALARYGQELGVCGMCGRTLTDEVSREMGIGPVCRSK